MERSDQSPDAVEARLENVVNAAKAQVAADAKATPETDGLERWNQLADAAAGMADPMQFEVRRSGFAARLERAAKRTRGLAAIWATWPQAKFNTAAVDSLREVGSVLETEQQWVAELHAAHRAELAILAGQIRELRAELDQVRDRHSQTLEEHRVVMRQLALEVSEATQLADRTRRSVEQRANGSTSSGFRPSPDGSVRSA